MANHFRMDDPMETNFTNPTYSVDLTAKKDEPKKEAPHEEEQVASLQDLMDETPKKPKGKPVMDSNSLKNAQEFDPTVLIPKKEKVDEGANEVYNALDLAVERTKKEITEFHNDLEAKMYEEFVEKENDTELGTMETEQAAPVTIANFEPEEEEDDLIHEEPTSAEPEKVINVPKFEPDKNPPKEEKKETKKVSVSKTAGSEFEYEESELDKDLKAMTEESQAPEEDNTESDEDVTRKYIDSAKTVIKPKHTIDLSKFSISKEPVKASTIIVNTAHADADIADWIMYDAGRSIAVKGLTGAELLKLNTNNNARNRLNMMKDTYKIIYDHVVDEKKPDFYTWMKQVKYSDIDHIYFALYMATFHGSNFISYQCPDCKKVFTKEIPFQDCVKYADDEVKAKVKEMQELPTDNGVIPYNVDLVQVNDKFVFGMKIPSAYNLAIETSSMPRNILDKYSDLIDTITYIDAVYTIDYTNMQLIPVAIPVVKDDPVKSAAKKIKTLYDILKSLTSDEFFSVRGYIAKTETEGAKVTYQIPTTKCPDCDTEIPGETVTAEGLLFTRHQLGAFANM